MQYVVYKVCPKSAQTVSNCWDITNKYQIPKIENLPKTANYLSWHCTCLQKFHLLETNYLVYIYYSRI